MKTYTHLYTNNNDLFNYMSNLNVDVNADILVQIYTNISDNNKLFTINSTINSFFNNAQIIGSNSCCRLHKDNITNKDIIISFTLFKKSRVKVFLYEFENSKSKELAKQIIENETTKSSKVMLLYTNISLIENEYLLQELKKYAPHIYIEGSITNDTRKSIVFKNGSSYSNGLVGAVIDSEELYVSTFNDSSYVPIGREYKVTDADQNIIKTINNVPAKQFYEKYLGIITNDNIETLGTIFPLLVKTDNILISKPVLSITDDNYLITNSIVKKGDSISLGYRDIYSFINTNKNILQDISKVPCESIFVFSCSKREEMASKYLKYNFPLSNTNVCGVSTDWNIITSGSISSLSKDTLSILVMSENPNNYASINLNSICESDYDFSKEQTTLLKLVNITSNELNVLNQTLENMVMQKTNELLEQYYTDYLTKLPNLNRLIESIENNTVSSLALIDISSFININNFYGNHIGNNVLKELASLLISYCSLNGFSPYRVHSDIFAVATNGLNTAVFESLIKDLQYKIHSNCFIESNHKIYINTTVSVTSMKHNVYENASMTLEYAKTHKIPFLVYNEDLKIEDAIKHNLIWTSKIRTAINNNKIIPYYQPIYNNSATKIDRFEVLMRLIDEDGQIITPYMFLDIAKKANLYKSLTKIIIEKAFNNFRNSDFKFSINLSSEDIIDENIRNFIYDKLDNFDHPQNVIFEIVESEGIENYDIVIEFINEIKKYKTEIAIDDFGTGFSNFHYLFKLNVDCIKIDGSIIQQINEEKAAKLVAETIVDFAKRMGITTVAEYVSNEEIFNKTNELGIDYCQGYFVSKPKENINDENN